MYVLPFPLQLLLFIIGTASCAQLNNNYLPPANAKSAGGSGPGLVAPKGPGSGGGFSGQGGFGANVPLAPPRVGGSPPRGGPAPAPSQPSGPPIEIISYENVNNGDGSYKWSYESANGIKAQETGDVKNKGSDNAIQTVQGSYSYTSPEGQVIEITYTADENGFQAQGRPFNSSEFRYVDTYFADLLQVTHCQLQYHCPKKT